MDVTNQGPLVMISRAWTSLLKLAQEAKDKRFSKEAVEGLRFFCGPYDFFFKGIRSDKFFTPGYDPTADIIVTINKAAEMVQIFGPNLYQVNPTRRATTRPIETLGRGLDPQLFSMDPQSLMAYQQAIQMAQVQHSFDKSVASLFECMQNVTPDKLDLKTEARRAIDEALITGLGLLWCENIVMPGTGQRISGSLWGSSRDFLMDPSSGTISGIGWCARRTMMHKWKAERRWRLPPNTLHAVTTSTSIDGYVSAMATGDTVEKDLVEVWEVWSKVGIGGRNPECAAATADVKAAYELFGDYCYLVIVPNHPWPLNLPPWMFLGEDPWIKAKLAAEWPTPHWLLHNGWPFSPVYFHEVPNDPWPMSHLTPGMGELKFLNWFYSKLVSKIGVTSRDIIVVAASIEKELEKVIKSGKDLSVVKVEGLEGIDIDKVIKFLQHPTWTNDIWEVAAAIEKKFEERVGLSELLYGGTGGKQIRSAGEAEARFQAVGVRPQDMSNKVDDAMSLAARNEMLSLRWHMRPEDVGALLGPLGAFAWSTLVYGQDPTTVLNIQMRIESDSSKKPNKGELAQDLSQAMQMLLQPLFAVAQMGLPQPFNALVTEWASAQGLQDPQRFTITMPTPVAPQPGAGQGQPAQAA